jgi:hypothetical protein
MPSIRLEIPVSRRAQPRPRLLQLVSLQGDGLAAAAVPVRLEVADGSFALAELVKTRDVVTASDGIALIQWYEAATEGPRRDLVSVVQATWQSEDIFVYLEDLYE